MTEGEVNINERELNASASQIVYYTDDEQATGENTLEMELLEQSTQKLNCSTDKDVNNNPRQSEASCNRR